MIYPKTLAWKLLRHSIVAGDIGCLEKLLSSNFIITKNSVNVLLDELTDSVELRETLDSQYARLWDSNSSGLKNRERLRALLALDKRGRGRALFLYAATRLLRPKVVVETGCFTGWDSAVILQALHRNDEGHLYSIDLPARTGQFSQVGPGSGLPIGCQPGFLVPEAFKDRWTLTIGNVRQELPPLLEKLGQVDLFYHDSDHTYVHMMWEYTTVWPYLAERGLLVSDDIAWNTAFWDFAKALGRPFVIHRNTPNVGALPKTGIASWRTPELREQLDGHEKPDMHGLRQ